MEKIKLLLGGEEFVAVLEETPTSRKLLAALPMVSVVNTWGEEIYFEIPVSTELEPGAKDVVDPGTVCFWVEGHSLAIPFGPTPASRSDECRLVTKVNLLGKIHGDLSKLKKVHTGDKAIVRAYEKV